MNYMMIDCETTNGLDDPLVYDVGYEVFDEEGRTIEKASMTNKDIFLDKEFMATAYYAEKIPNYWMEIWTKKRELLSWERIKWRVYDACKRNNCLIVAAHNARFDRMALNLTQRYITTSRYRFFLPYGTTWWCSMRMAKEVLKNNAEYKSFCKYYNFMTANNQPRFTAEILYKFISGDVDFEEVHQGIDDVEIEKEIFLWCLAQKPEIDGRLFKPKEEVKKPLEDWEIELAALLA